MDSLQKLDIKLLEGTSLFGHLLLLKPTLSTILCKWKQDSVVSSSYIWILFSNISINWFIINPQL